MILPSTAKILADVTTQLHCAGEPDGPQASAVIRIHLELLARWNRAHNLTRIESWEQVLDRHLKESLLPLRWIGERGRLLDIGTGNGFPALPILACRPGLEATLVERSERKALFLDAVVREAGMKGVRIEQRTGAPRRGPEDEDAFDFVISRATLPPERYLRLAASWARSGGRIFLYGSKAAWATEIRTRNELSLRLVAREAIEQRNDSFLFVFER